MPKGWQQCSTHQHACAADFGCSFTLTEGQQVSNHHVSTNSTETLRHFASLLCCPAYPEYNDCLRQSELCRSSLILLSLCCRGLWCRNCFHWSTLIATYFCQASHSDPHHAWSMCNWKCEIAFVFLGLVRPRRDEDATSITRRNIQCYQ